MGPSSHTSTSPKTTHAFLVGGGIASLSAAVYLIQDAQLLPSQIHIIDSGPLSGGSMDGAGNPEDGYSLRGGRMLNFSYHCLYDLLSKIPSLTDPQKTVMQELTDFNAGPENRTNAHARIVSGGIAGPEIVNVGQMGLSGKDRIDLVHLVLETERDLGTRRINDYFQKDFFKTNFWYMWATTFAFQPWHSVIEFRRYLHRFVHEFRRINTLAGVDRTPYNQYESIILPIESYLKSLGVDFHYDTRVTQFSFTETPETSVHEIHTNSKGATGLIHVNPQDVVFATIGSMTSCSSLGTNAAPPEPLPGVSKTLHAPDGAWQLWESFKVTSSRPSIFGALITFKDSPWLLSIVVPKQPHFINQPPNVQVFWGYGLFPAENGQFVQKPMASCSGSEILTELLGHLDFPLQPTISTSTTIPCMMPFITSQFLTRKYDDRPKVVPERTTNLALLGQFVEIENDVVFTVEYSVRGAMIAVSELMETGKKVPDIYRGDHNVKVLAEALRTLLV